MRCVVIHANILWAIVNFRLGLMQCLQKEGFKVVCVSDTDSFSQSSLAVLEQNDIEFYRVPISRKGLNPLGEIRYMYALWRVYRHIKPDIVLSYSIKPNIFGNFVAKALNIPVISTINGLGSGFLGKSWLKAIVKTLYMFALKFAKIVFFQNQEDRKFFIKDGLVCEKKARYVAGSGIGVEAFGDCEKQEDGKISFCLIARLLRDKGILEYIEAIRLLRKSGDFPQACFYLGGAFDDGNPSGISKDELLAWEQEGLVSYLGVTDDIKNFLRLSDVVVLPSYREGLSRVLLEAASAKKAIIATDVAGCRDVVEDGENGFLVEAHSPKSLYEGFLKILSLNKESLSKMGEAGFEKVKNEFSQDKINKIYLDVICEVLKK
ncbi:MAG: glycosyltransferase family 4 protein [Sulfurospirillaceae bacterium]|nr:glycosyltransferase family 4 protein [Sulfurospirillaceae bacterium]